MEETAELDAAKPKWDLFNPSPEMLAQQAREKEEREEQERAERERQQAVRKEREREEQEARDAEQRLRRIEGRLATPLGSLLSDAELGQAPTTEWVVERPGERVIRDRSLTLLYGHPGTMKTFLALGIGHSVAADVPWAGFDVLAGPVLYVAAEGQDGLRVRQQAWLKSSSQSGAPNFHVYPVPVNLLRLESWDDSEADVPRLVQTVASGVDAYTGEAMPYRLVIIDTLNRCIGGASETDSTMATVVEASRRMQEAGAAVLIIHHPDKGDRDLRGHSALRGAADTVLHVRLFKGVVQVKVDKQKDAPDGWSFNLRPVVVPLGDGESSVVLADAAIEDAQADDVLSALAGCALTQTEIAEATGAARSSLQRTLKKMMDSGRVEMNPPEGGRGARYGLTGS
jgi:hypothetical protein